jgi:hypothetical protein
MPPNFSHSNNNKETTQTKKTIKSKDLGVCIIHTAPHPHKENKRIIIKGLKSRNREYCGRNLQDYEQLWGTLQLQFLE